ncbi:glycosyltransferase [Lacrimispora saccharolytica]|nr:glycosyltransferase [Lacrimispora saccharolytica]
MKKILFVIPTMRMGGAEKSLVTLLNCIDRKKYKIDLLLFEGGGILQNDIPANVNIILADSVTQAMILEFRYYAKNLLKKHQFIAYIRRLWTSVNPKIKKNQKFCWSYLRNSIPFFEKEYDIAISYLEGLTAYYVIDKVIAKKKIGWIHIDMTDRTMLQEEQQYYEKFDYLITISEVCRKVFVKLVPSVKGRISVLENLTDLESIKDKAKRDVDFSGWNKNKIQIVTVGRLDTQKGIDLAVFACKRLRDEGFDVCWHVYGEGVQRNNLEKMIEENRLQNFFILEGVKTNPYPYMAKADIIVQSSRYEGKSIVLDEAKILGKAIVVTNYPSVKDQITNGETGIIVDCSPREIAEGVKQLIGDENTRKKIEENNSVTLLSNTEILNKFYQILEL